MNWILRVSFTPLPLAIFADDNFYTKIIELNGFVVIQLGYQARERRGLREDNKNHNGAWSK